MSSPTRGLKNPFKRIADDPRSTHDHIDVTEPTGTAAADSSGRHPVDKVPTPAKLLIYGLQHLLVMYASTVTVPVIVASALNLSQADLIYLVTADLLLCGFGTLLQSLGIWKVGVGLPMVVGASYTGIAPMLVIGQGSDLQTMYGAILVVGILTIAVAPLVSRLMRLFPPVVIGTTILLIGIQLVPAGGRMIVGTDPEDPDFGAPSNIGLAAATVLAILLCYRLLPNAFRAVSVLIGMLIGVAIAALTTGLDLSSASDSPAITLPNILHFGAPRFDLLAIASLAIIQLVLLVELAGQVNAVGDVVGRKVPDEKLASAVRADGVITVLGGGVFQSFMYVTFAQNVGILTITKVFSRYVTAATGVLLLVLAIFPVVGEAVAAIPRPVLGAAAAVMFGTIAVVGIRILSQVDYSQTSNIIITASALGVALLPTTISGFYDQFPDSARQILGSGVATGVCVAVLLNLMFNFRRPTADEASPSESTH